MKKSGHCILSAFEIMAVSWKHTLCLCLNVKNKREIKYLYTPGYHTLLIQGAVQLMKLRRRSISKGESVAWTMQFAAPLFHFISQISFCYVSSKEVTGICQNVMGPMFEILDVNTLIQSSNLCSLGYSFLHLILKFYSLTPVMVALNYLSLRVQICSFNRISLMWHSPN